MPNVNQPSAGLRAAAAVPVARPGKRDHKAIAQLNDALRARPLSTPNARVVFSAGVMALIADHRSFVQAMIGPSTIRTAPISVSRPPIER